MAKHKISLEMNDNVFAYLLNIPSILIIFVTILFPIVYSLRVSTLNWNLKRPNNIEFIGLQNYFSILTSPDYLSTLLRTFLFVFFSVGAIMLLGLAVAILLNQSFMGRGALRAVILIPWAIPSVVNGLLWKWVLNSSYGILNAILKGLGIIDTYQPFLARPLSASLIPRYLSNRD